MDTVRTPREEEHRHGSDTPTSERTAEIASKSPEAKGDSSQEELIMPIPDLQNRDRTFLLFKPHSFLLWQP